MLKPSVITARINRNRCSPCGVKYSRQFERFISQSKTHNANSCAENARKMFKVRAPNFLVQNYFKRQNARVKINRLVHIRHGKTDRFDF